VVAWPGCRSRPHLAASTWRDRRVLIVFDSVTASPGTPAGAQLAFTGWEVRYADPVFDADTPTLFDFRVPQGRGSRFVYVLPADGHRALVELTAFVPGPAGPPPPAALAGYLHGGYEILRTESAVVPLHTRPARRASGRVLRIGARAGLVKASTGYGYQRIQRDSAAIAASLARDGHPFARPVPRRRYRLLDAVLLDVLRHEPVQLERAFARLFLDQPAARMLRFLDEDTGPGDELRLIAALPPLPYLRAATRQAWHRAGSID